MMREFLSLSKKLFFVIAETVTLVMDGLDRLDV